MDKIIVIEVVGVLLAWTAAGYAIWRWGPGLRQRAVRCPETRMPAEVIAEQREAEFACLRTVDVKACSLLPDVPVTCSKACLSRL